MAFRSVRVVAAAANTSVPLAASPTMVRNLIVSPLENNLNDVVVGDEGVDAILLSRQGHTLRIDSPPLRISGEEPIDVSGIFMQAAVLDEGLQWTGDVV